MIKQAIKKIIGQENITFVRQNLKAIKDRKYLHGHARIQVVNNNLLYQKYAQKDKHVFFGYYDIPQLDAREERLLVHVVRKGADASKDRAELGYCCVASGRYVPCAHTNAWCWQQGSRLRWHPTERDTVLFNDMRNGRYLTRVVNLEAGKTLSVIREPLYDLDPTGTFGLSVNFSRLQRLRPGYGYSTLPDQTAGQAAPAADGIFYVDIAKNKEELIISLADLAAEVKDPSADEHYINHVSISPDGKKFMFFHIWTLKEDTHWKTRLCVYDLERGELKVLEEQDRVSHYDWIGSDRLIITCWDKDRRQYYCTYDVITGEKARLANKELAHDGHPTYLPAEDIFISDTYPLANDMQTLFEYDVKKDSYRPIIRLYSEPKLYDEKRCDLHPRLSASGKYITLDTTCQHGVKQVLLIKNWRDKKN